MNALEKKLVKLVTTDISEVQEKIKNELANSLAKAFFYEGSLDRVRILYAEQSDFCNDETFVRGVLSHSNVPSILNDILGRAIKNARTL